jgi:hypothetical protein
MSTDNPKVSGYVPQHIYDHFKVFCEERGISMSQAVTVIFAEYFGLELQVDHKVSTGGLLVERVGLLEQELASLKHLIENRLLNVNTSLAQMLDRPLVVQPDSLPSEVPMSDEAGESSISVNLIPGIELPGELRSGLLNKLPSSLPTELANELPSELPIPEKTQNTEKSVEEVASKVKLYNPLHNLLGEPLGEIKPVSGRALSKCRFGLNKDAVSGKKKSLILEKFIEWSKNVDPDNIPWEPKGNPLIGYIPVGELSSEQKSKLLEWQVKNGLS